ncbi:MAG: hypothetical protein O7B99_11855, partial [Planctomycetota bacterium]|nr:hypothetical protein [Planctomycetota bacterium]
LKLDFKGGKPDWLVVQGGGTYERAFFDVAAGGKTGIQVPAGRYELFAGQLSQGKKSQIRKALILPSRNTPAWNVDAGGTTTIELGAPFGLDFVIEQDDETVTIVGDTVLVTGRTRETYQRLWNCTVQPDVSVRRAGTKRGAKPEGMKRSETQEEISDNGYKSAWFPLDLTLTKKRKGTDVEVQLFVKKNKLFGKIESEWRN